MFERIRAMFSSYKGSSASSGISGAKTIVNQIVSWVMSISRFDLLDDSDVYEQMYVYESDVGGGIDKIASMIANSFKYFYIPDVGDTRDEIEVEMEDAANSIFNGTTPQLALGSDVSRAPRTPQERTMLRKSTTLFRELDVTEDIEAFAEVLMIQGNLFLTIDEDDPTVYNIQPNKYVTLIDDMSRKSNPGDTAITQGNILIVNENQGEDKEKIFNPGEFIHIKYKKTPIWMTDQQGRSTYGLYSISPMMRAVLPTWQKRQMSIVDLLWRWASVPKKHHKIASDMFALQRYTGPTWAKKGEQASADALKYLEQHAKNVKDLMPDQDIASLDSVTIDVIEPKSTSYVAPNDLITQLTDQVMTAINVPKSLGLGTSTSSFASELIIATYTSEKIIQLARRIKPVILKVIRLRLLEIDPSFPIDSLDIKIDHTMAISRLEMFRVFAIMVNSGLFTEAELRECVGYEQLSPDQVPYTPNAPVSTTASTPTGSPETPESAGQHITDSGKRTYKKIENKSRGEQV